MRLRTVLVLGAMVALCSASDAWAQGRGFGRGGFGGTVTYFGLLRVEKIQDAVKVTDDQQQKLDDARQALAEQGGGRRGAGGQNFQDMTDEERQEFFAQLATRRAEQAKAEKAKVAEILDEGQVKRLGEIFIQVAGADALNDADVAAALKITEDLQEKLATARQEAQAAMVEGFQDLQDLDQDERAEKIAELRAESDKAILAVLSADQQKQLADMKGEALELTSQELSQARRGGRRGGGGGGGRGGRGRGGRGAQ